MRIMGKSPVDKTKYIVEITEKELQMFKKSPPQPKKPAMQERCGDEDFFNILQDNMANEEMTKERENKITTDDVLDNYIDKKINREQMTNAINAILRR